MDTSCICDALKSGVYTPHEEREGFLSLRTTSSDTPFCRTLFLRAVRSTGIQCDKRDIVDEVCEAELHGGPAPHLSAASGFSPD